MAANRIVPPALAALAAGLLPLTAFAATDAKTPPAATTGSSKTGTQPARKAGTTTGKAKTAAATTKAAATTTKAAATTTKAATTAARPTTQPVRTAPAATTQTASTIPTVTGPKIDDMPGDDPKVDLPAGDRTVVGDTFPVEAWGTATVTIVVTGGKIVAVSADLPWSSARSKVINSRVGPYLNEQAIVLQAAKLNLISGATRTCDGYYRSLQSAIDRAQLARGELVAAR